ncbi:MAG: patatin family protein [Lachnospiraceae bacterium]|nr:patatin family protein [Lachnospiraceae bacterium]
MKKIGLILEGGANRGIFTAGVLDLFKSKDIYLPYVVSVSVGTCNAIDYVSKQFGRTKECMIPNGRNVPPVSIQNIPKKKTMINLDMVFDEYPNHLVPFDYATYWSSDIISEYVVTNCITGQAEYLSEKQDAKRLMNICRASCSMPYLSPITMLDGIPYLDGGIADAVPIRHARSLGYEKNIVVLTREKGYFKRDLGILNMMDNVLYRKYPRLIRQLKSRIKRYNKTIELLEKLEERKDVLIIRPSKVLVGRTGNNTKRLNQFYQQGYQIGKRRLREIQEFIDLGV